uniref:DM10 domain-containing protein n=1 Tax=Ascaris lumbricoides TaxID=6252 RepID=A0A0M3IHE8_ASCLU
VVQFYFHNRAFDEITFPPFVRSHSSQAQVDLVQPPILAGRPFSVTDLSPSTPTQFSALPPSRRAYSTYFEGHCAVRSAQTVLALKYQLLHKGN